MANPASPPRNIAVTVVVAILVAVAGSYAGARIGGLPVFALCVALAFIINWVVFVPSFKAQTEKYFDLAGSFTYLTVIVVALAFAENRTLRTWVLASMVVVWAVRLGSFLFARVHRAGGDGRFDAIKPNRLLFLQFWTIQGLWVTLTAGAALAAMTAKASAGFGWISVAGVVVWVIGFGIEVVADRQKQAFRAEPANDGRFITSGLWAWSRHPNYFGEITLWLGVALVALPALSGWQYVTLISPVFVYLLLTRISGIPALESRAKKRWGAEPAFQDYKSKTPSLMLRPPRS